MCHQAFHEEPNETQDELEFSSYLPKLGEGKQQSEEKQTRQLLVSFKIVRDWNDMNKKVFPNLQSRFRDEDWIAQQGIFTTQTSAFRNTMKVWDQWFSKHINNI